MQMMQKNNNKIIYPELSFKINGILFKIGKQLNRFRNEKQYCDAIELALQNERIKYEREKILPPSFDGEHEGRNKIDFLIEEKIILEIKSKPFITKNDYYQVKRYLTSLNKKLAILVNMRYYYIKPIRVLNADTSE